MFFRPTSQGAFTAKQLTEEDISENMNHVHNAGSTYGKYLPYQRNSAPLLDRMSCKYTRDFPVRTNVNLQKKGNDDLAESFRGPPGMKAPKVNQSGVQSAYNENFGVSGSFVGASKKITGRSLGDMLSSRRTPINPIAEGGTERVLGGAGKGSLLVKTSSYEETHTDKRHAPFNPNGDGSVPIGLKDNLKPAGCHAGNFLVTAYHSDFGLGSRRKRPVGTLLRTMDRSSSAPGGSSLAMGL